jgi:hypothetical protein
MVGSLLGWIIRLLTGGEDRFMLQVKRYRPHDSSDGREHVAARLQTWGGTWAYAYAPRKDADYREIFVKLSAALPFVEVIIDFKKSNLGNQVDHVCFLIPENPDGSPPRDLDRYGLEPVTDEERLLSFIGLPEPEVYI